MGASRIETEYNEINSKNGWMMEFQVNFDLIDKLKNKHETRGKNTKILHRTFEKKNEGAHSEWHTEQKREREKGRVEEEMKF